MSSGNRKIQGKHAVVGMDVVSFSELTDDEQVKAITLLMEWVRAALDFHLIKPSDFRWSPAGDGGYLTFKSTAACELAVDVAFDILRKTREPKWVPANGKPVSLRFAVNAGTVIERKELGRNTNVWGAGINEAARILSVAADAQVLVSESYFEGYLQRREKHSFHCAKDIQVRTVKHGRKVRVRNICRDGLGLSPDEAQSVSWRAVQTVWKRTYSSYESLISDAMHSGNVIAALAAAKFLLSLDDNSPAVDELCNKISDIEYANETDKYPDGKHELLSKMPSMAIKDIIRQSITRSLNKGDELCHEGDEADGCYFPVSGTILVTGTNIETPIRMSHGKTIGEFGLLAPTMRRSATLVAADEALVLEVKHDSMRELMTKYHGVSDAIHGLVKPRMTENVCHSKFFFPGLNHQQLKELVQSPAICGTHAAGQMLDLQSRVYILYNGRVQVQSTDHPHVVEANGVFSEDTVLGVFSGSSLIDGKNAKILCDSVTVSFPLDVVRRLEREVPAVKKAWHNIRGIRREHYEELKRPMLSVDG